MEDFPSGSLERYIEIQATGGHVSDNLRPVPGDSDADEIIKSFDLASDDWLLTTEEDVYKTSAAETWKFDGSGWQRVVILEWPARKNHEHSIVKLVRLMMSPEDALGLSEALNHTAKWLMAAKIVENHLDEE